MAAKNTTFHTGLSIQECAAVFREAADKANNKSSRMIAKMLGKDTSGFYTPSDNSPFSALDDDKPDFTVGAFIIKFNGGGQGAGTNLHMYIWDRGEYREVSLVAPHGFGGGMHASKVLRTASQAFQTHDPSVQMVGQEA